MSNELNEPVLDGAGQAPEEARVRGILAQVRADTALYPEEDTQSLLRTRLADAGIVLDIDRFQQLLREANAPTERTKKRNGGTVEPR